MVKLARHGRLKICYIRNVVGSNPTCGTIFSSLLVRAISLVDRSVAQRQRQQFERLSSVSSNLTRPTI